MASIPRVAACLLLVILAVDNGKATPGGAQIRISSKGLQYGASLGMQVLMRELKKVSIPDQGDSKDIGIGHAHWKATGIHIKNVAIPNYTVRPVSGGRLRATVSGVSVDAGGHIGGGVTMKGVRTCIPYPCGWGKWCKKCHTIRPPGINIGTGVSIRARSISFTLEFDVGVNGGKPTVRASGCNARLPRIDIDLSSGVLDVIYNAIAPVLKHFLTPVIQNIVCQEASKAINKELNNVFQTFPVAQNIDTHSRINYEIKQVSGTNDYFDMILRGEFQPRSGGSSNLPMTVFPPTSSSAKMVYIWISDFTANTFGKVYQDAGLFKYIFKPSTVGIPKEVTQMLNTQSLAAFFPDLARIFPNRPMQLRAASYKAPTFHFSPGSAAVNLYASANFDVIKADGKPEPAFWIKLDIKASGSVSVSQGASRIHGQIHGFKFAAQVGGYTLGKYNLPLDDPMIQGVVQGIIMQANPELAKGFPLPTLQGLTLKNEKVTFVQNAVRVEGDINYRL